MKFYIIGIDDNDKPQLGGDLLEIISKGTIFSGGSRHRQIVSKLLPEEHIWIDVTPPMDALFQRYANHSEVVVFASGDPLFYGFASTLQRFAPQAEMEIYPTFNSLQTLAHKAQIAYHNMRSVSLTGRTWERFDEALIEGAELIGVLTDTKNHTPEKIAQRMLKYGYSNYQITVGELLGNCQNERISRLSVEEVAEGDFLHPCNMILELTHKRNRPFGIKDCEFKGLEGRSKMITKQAIRLALLSMLELRGAKTFWDIGFCTGSVSIESKLQFPHLKVYSFEKREESREIMEHNLTKFGALGIEYYIGDFMECDLEGISPADALFIGGHGGDLKAIVKRCMEYMNSGGRIVFNSVSTQSEALFEEAIRECEMEISESLTMKVDEFNTIKIIKAIYKNN